MAAKVMSFQALHQCISSSVLTCSVLVISFIPLFGQDVDVLIVCKDKQDWSPDQISGTKHQKAIYVYDRLKDRALSQQSAVKSFLESHQIVHTAFTVVNAIHAVIPQELIDDIARIPTVDYITENSEFRQERVTYEQDPTSRSAGPEWGILHIRADSVWALGYRGQGVVVGGEDTGFDWEHPAIRSKYRGETPQGVSHDYNWHDAIHEINPLNGDSTIAAENNPCGLSVKYPCDDHGHGTHTMGTMVGSDGDNEIGVAPEAKWIACRNMERGWGSPASYLECMEWFLAPTDVNGENPDPTKAPHVINNSWSCPEVEGCNPDNFELMRQAVVNLRAAGIVVVVSAGNSGSGCGSVSTPLAMFEESFTVGAINSADTIAGFSSRGPVTIDSSLRTKPNIAAPGVQVRSAWLDSTYRFANGTSMAGPHVVGVVALMISANPELGGQVDLIEDIIEMTARQAITEQECGEIPGSAEWNNTYGHGVIDALAAVEAALLVSGTSEISPKESPKIVCFPNPASAQLHVTDQNGSAHVSTLRMYSTDGVLVRAMRDLALPGIIDIDGLPRGLYILQADTYAPVLIHVIRD